MRAGSATTTELAAAAGLQREVKRGDDGRLGQRGSLCELPLQALRFAAMSESFRGHELETGILQRIRRWQDALPILVLGKALRVSGSPLYVGMSLLAVLLGDALGLSNHAFSIAVANGGEASAGSLDAPVRWPAVLGPLQGAGNLLINTAELGLPGWRQLLAQLAMVLLWSLPAATLARAGACYAAQRDQAFSQNLAIAGQRLPGIWAATLVPAIGVLGLCGLMFGVGLLQRGGTTGAWLGELAALLVVPVMIFAGLLAAGAVAAVPLAWAAMVIEKRGDVFDSLSRGYEYLYRRPVQLLTYALGGYLLVLITYGIGWAVAGAALNLGGAAARAGSAGLPPPAAAAWLLSALPTAVALSTLWAMVGAIYLLMRQAANGQEIEEIAVSEVDRQAAQLPTLRTETTQTTPTAE